MTNCADAQISDFSTDKGILEQLGKLKNKEFGKDEICIQRLKESAKIIVIGYFAHDAGCRFEGVFVNSRYFEKNDFAASKNALDVLGWKTANRQKREELAKLWVEKGLLAFSKRDNQVVAAVSSGDGKIKVIVSLQFPPGVTSRHAPQKFSFDEDGSLSSKIGN